MYRFIENSAECKKPKGAQLAALVSNPPGSSGYPVYLPDTPNTTCSCGNLTAKYLFAPEHGNDPNLGGFSVFYALPSNGEPSCHNLCIKAKGNGGKHVYYTSPNSSSVQYVEIFTYCPTPKSCANYAMINCPSANSSDGLVDKKGKVV